MKIRLLLATIIAFAPAAWAESLAGLWNATVNVSGTEVPFKIEFSGDGSNIKGWFFNGEEFCDCGSLTRQANRFGGRGRNLICQGIHFR